MLEDEDIDETLIEEYEQFFKDKVDSGQDPLICAMIMLSQGISICKLMMSEEDFNTILEMTEEYAKELDEMLDTEIPEGVVLH